MPERALLDSDMLSEVFRGRNRTVIEAASGYLDYFDRLTISAVTVAEVVKGLRKKGHQAGIEMFAASFEQTYEVLPIDAEVARIAGELIAKLELSGVTIGAFDCLIAATAIHHMIPLITGNERHFRRVQDAGFPLRLGNWRINSEVR